MKGHINEKDVIQMYEDNHSTHQISEKYNTYPNKIRRILIKNGVTLKDKSEAQKNALASGKSVHPTEGRSRTDKEKMSISRSSVKHWENMSDEEREERRKKSKAAWDSMTPSKKAEMRKKASMRIREAAKNGSKMEKKVQDMLARAGYHFQAHKKDLIPTQKLEIDIYLPKIHTIIEVDGLSHFEPIWGDEQLQKQQKFDAQKDGLILGKGFKLIRIENIGSSMALSKLADLEKALVTALREIESGKGTNLKVIRYE